MPGCLDTGFEGSKTRLSKEGSCRASDAWGQNMITTSSAASSEIHLSLPEILYIASIEILRERHVRLGRRESQICASLLRTGVEPTPRVRVAGYSVRTVRRILRKNGLPSPCDWVGLSRCSTTLRAAEKARISLERAALQTSWHDASAFSRRCLILLGRRPGALRGMHLKCIARIWFVRRGRFGNYQVQTEARL